MKYYYEWLENNIEPKIKDIYKIMLGRGDSLSGCILDKRSCGPEFESVWAIFYPHPLSISSLQYYQSYPSAEFP